MAVFIGNKNVWHTDSTFPMAKRELQQEEIMVLLLQRKNRKPGYDPVQ